MFPLATLTHMSTSYHGPDAEEFDGLRWVESGKGAATINQTYFPFGLGRWACPGRVLAVSGESAITRTTCTTIIALNQILIDHPKVLRSSHLILFIRN